MEELQARHRKAVKDLQSKVTQKKKSASKKTRKGINDECDRLEADLKAQHAAEIAALDGVTTMPDELDEFKMDEPEEPAITQPATQQSEQPAQRKPNRQKARLARREADREEAARQAAEEAEDLPDMKQQERDRMLSYMSEHKLHEKEIRADGHCLYSAIADQLDEAGIALGDAPDATPNLRYKTTRATAADYIKQHSDDFAAFLEEPLDQYVRKIRETAEWGGQLELQALSKAYSVQINVLQDFGRVEKIMPEDEVKATVWLSYYRHGFGLGEHYNSLHKVP